MKIIVRPSGITGVIEANPSKSHMQRAVALAAFYGTELFIAQPCLSKDCLASLSVAGAMGCRVKPVRDGLKITPGQVKFKDKWWVGESGLSARVFGIMAAFYHRKISLWGEGSIMDRSMKGLVEALRELGVKVETAEDKLPLEITGPVKNNSIRIDGNAGSQVLTGLLLALPSLKEDSQIKVNDLKSKPYIDITLAMMRDFGLEVSHRDYSDFFIPGGQKPDLRSYTNEGDWSGAAFLLAGGAMCGPVGLRNLDPGSFQGDRAILSVLQKVGAKLDWSEGICMVQRGQLDPFEFDATDTPDLFPPLASLAAFTTGICRIKGVDRLHDKESDRFQTLSVEFGKLGVPIRKERNEMIIEGGAKIRSGKVFAHHDHRIAMALAILALRAEGPVEISGFECIHKSYPDFLKDLEKLGADIQLIEA